MLRVTPIYGSQWSSQGQAEEPTCTLVEYGDCRVLLNVGWTKDVADDFPPSLPDHDCLLLTDSTLQSTGGLPMYYQQQIQKRKLAKQNVETTMKRKSIGSDIKQEDPDNPDEDNTDATPLPPIYATFPVVKMAQMTLYDQHANISLDGGRPPFTLTEIDDAIQSIECIKYSQQIQLKPHFSVLLPHQQQLPTLSITAHRAGYVVGGSFFVLQRLQDETTVVLTKTYHIAKELHLDSSTLLKHASTPDVLVTYPGGPSLAPFKALATRGSPPPLAPQLVTQVERQLTEAVLATLRRNGHVLLPVDPASRSLELVFLLNQHWERNRLNAAYNLVFLGPMVQNTVEFAKSQLEWMAEKLLVNTAGGDPNNNKGGAAKESSSSLQNLLRTINFCATESQVEQLMQSNPTCILATGLSLEHGPARNLLLSLADNPDNAVIFTDSSQAYLRPKSSSSNATVEPVRSESTVLVDDESKPQEDQDGGEGNPTEDRTDRTPNEITTDNVNSKKDDPAVVMDEEPNEEVTGDSPGGSNANALKIVKNASLWTTAAQMLRAWGRSKARGLEEMEDSIFVDVKVPRRLPLAGAELKAFLAAEEEARRLELKRQEQQAMLREVELAKGQLRLGEDEDAATGSVANKTTVSTTSRSVVTRPRKESRFDQTLFLKFSTPLFCTFEVREEAVGIGQVDSIAKFGIGESIGRSGEVLEDDYGIAVQAEQFTDIVSGVDSSKFGTSGRVGEDVLRRGFGYAGSGANTISEDGGSDGAGGEGDEQEMEAIDLSEGNGIIRGRNGRPPMKVSTVTRKLEVLAEISYIPMEGRVDARAARQSVRALQPRNLIILGGPAPQDDPTPDFLVDSVKQLSEAARSFSASSATSTTSGSTPSSSKPILTPSDGETVELNVGHAAYAVRLVDTPYQTAEESGSGEPTPDPVEPYEVNLGASTVSWIDHVATGQKVALDGSLVLAPSKTKSSPSLYLSAGEVLLTDLRSELTAQGYKADYSAHKGYSQLLVNGMILVRKEQNSGQIQVEGPLCEDFWTVRQVVSRQFSCL